jgi:protein TonB
MSKVFLADRDPISRKSLGHALRQRGVEVEEFESGPALYARALAADPDLIVLDTDLEEMDGFQVFARLQRKRPEKPFPVLFVTDFDHPRVARICRERGAVGYIAKSRPLEQILDAILDALERPEPLAGRTLAGALAWLQSRGKTGRLDISDGEREGYVLLHKGRLLDAEWGAWRGEEVLSAFAAGVSGASFRFAEGIDDLARPAGAAPPVAARADALDAAAAAPLGRADAAATRVGERPVEPTSRPERVGAAVRSATPGASPPVPRRRVPLRVSRVETPEAMQPGGALAALHELQSRRSRRISGRKRRALAALAVVALIVGAGVGLARLYSGPLPASVRQMLTLIRLGEGEPVASVPRPQPKVPAEAPAVTEAAPPSVAPPADVVPAGRDEDSGGRFDVAPSSPASYGASFGPGVDRESTTPAAASNAPPAAAVREGPAARARPAEDAVTSKAPAVRDRQGAARVTPQASGRDRSAERPEPSREASRPPAPAAEEPSPDTERPAPPPAPPPAAPAPEPTQTAVEREAIPAPSPAPSEGRPAGDVPALASRATDEAAPGAKPLTQKPVLLKRGEGLYYPPELKAQGVGGNVLLKIRVGENGRAQQVEVAQSSGYDAFDQAAVAAVGTFLWDPARNADGATEAWITQAVTFRP